MEEKNCLAVRFRLCVDGSADIKETDEKLPCICMQRILRKADQSSVERRSSTLLGKTRNEGDLTTLIIVISLNSIDRDY